MLQFVGTGDYAISSLGAGSFASIGSGKLTASWDDVDGTGKSLSDGTVAFTIQLRAIGSNGTSSSVSFTDNPTAREVLVKVGTSLVTQTPSTSGGTITVSKPKPTITWSNPAAITYGTALSGTQLNAMASVLGSYSYTPSSGTVLQTGNNQTLSVTFTPNDTATYDNATWTVTITVNKATPTLNWSNPADIGYGTALSGTQLNATATSSSGANVSGTFAYTPSSGTVLNIGNNQTLSVTFTPTDAANYNSASTTAKINVVKGSQTITFGALSNKTFGDSTFNLSATASSGLSVSFVVAAGPATISGSTVTITGVGTVTIRASQAGDSNYNAAANVDQSFTVAKANQTITFGTLSNKTYGDAAFSLSATASSGLAVSFSVVSGPATVSGSTLTITGVGSVTVRASQAGNDNYNSAATVDQAFTVAKANQTITLGALSNKAYGDAAFGLSATASSGLPVSFAIVSGPATLSGSTLTITGVGSVTVRASQAGNDNYNAAPNVDQSFTVAKGNQTISFGALGIKYFSDAAFTVSATASSGLAVSFAVASGPATISGNMITITGVGNVTVRASQVGNDNFNAAANVDQAFTVGKGSQTISFQALGNKVYGEVAFAVSATASSGLPVSFSVASGPATVSGSTVTLTGAGTVMIRASQAGNDTYEAAATVDQSFTVAKASQTITFGALSDKTVGDAAFTVSATSSSGLPVSYSVASGPASVSGNNVMISGAGTVTIRASQAGDNNYSAAANVDRSFTVGKASQTISFGTLSGKTFGDAPFNVNASASSGLAVSFSVVSGPATVSGSTLAITGVGSVTVRASQPGNENYNAASIVDQSFTISKANQTITFPAPPNKVFGDPPFSLSATASSSLPVSFSLVSGPATISGSTVTVSGVGTVTVRASQAGNENYNAAVNVDQAFTVTKGNQTISFGGLSNRAFGDAAFSINASASSGLPVSFAIASGPATISGNTINIIGVGTVVVRASQGGNENFNPAPDGQQSFTVGKGNQTISFQGLANKVFGEGSFAVNATSSSGLPVSLSVLSGQATISGNAVTMTGAGTVTIRASQLGNDNYNAAPNVDQPFTVAKANQTITAVSVGDTVFGNNTTALTATTSSGLPVSFSVVSGPATIAGNTLTLTGVGAVTIRVSQPGNENYNPAPSIDRPFTVGKANQTITFGPLNAKTYGDAAFIVNATASSGLPVSFTVVSGPATISGNSVSITGAGAVVIRAAQAGNENYNATPNVDQSFTVAKANQTITFGALSGKSFCDAPITLSATSSSGLPVSYIVVSGPATISGNTLTFTGAGTVTVRASLAGNDNYTAAANVDQSFNVSKCNQTINFSALSNKSFGDPPFTVNATASSGFPVTFSIVSGPVTISGNTITVNGVGTVTIRASQAGNDNFNAAVNADQSFTVAKANQTITFGPSATKTFGDPSFLITATASSGVRRYFESCFRAGHISRKYSDDHRGRNNYPACIAGR